jgi:hypothetical protein
VSSHNVMRRATLGSPDNIRVQRAQRQTALGRIGHQQQLRYLHTGHRRRWLEDKPALLTLRHRQQGCEDSHGKDKAAHG